MRKIFNLRAKQIWGKILKKVGVALLFVAVGSGEVNKVVV